MTNLFELMTRRMEWAGARQGVLAQNVANADTPGYVPRDVTAFADVLNGRAIGMVTTDPGHMLPAGGAAAMLTPRPEEKAPDGNAVSLEAELVKIADTGQAQQVALNLYGRYLAMFRGAIGKA